jgi:hypothetical protein
MRAIMLGAAGAVVLSIAGLSACGLQSQGLLASDAGVVSALNVPVPEAAAPAADDATGTDEPAPMDDDAGTAGDDAGTAGNDADVDPGDAGQPPIGDSATPTTLEAAAPFTCTSCAAKMCPSQVAACGPGSDCIGYRDCNEACTIAGKKSCSTTCSSTYPAGSSAFSSLALCDIGCGGACVAQLSIGSP